MCIKSFSVTLIDLGTYTLDVVAFDEKQACDIAKQVLHEHAFAAVTGLSIKARETQGTAVLAEPQPAHCYRVWFSQNIQHDPRSFRDSYRWMGNPESAAQPIASRLPFRRDGRVHPMRARYEFYPTPPEATRALLSVEHFDGPIWEPACGRSAISMVLEAAGHQVVSTDLIQRDYGVGGIDFLRQTEPRARHIITNPPYGRGLGDEFVRHALALTRETGGTVAMLLNLASLCHPTRHDLWVTNPPSAIYTLDELVCWPEGDPGQARSSTREFRSS